MGLLRRIEGGSAPPAAANGASAPPGPTRSIPAAEAPSAPRPSVAPPRPGQNAIARDLKSRVKGRLIAELDPNMDLSKTAEVRQRIKSLFDQIVQLENIVLT